MPAHHLVKNPGNFLCVSADNLKFGIHGSSLLSAARLSAFQNQKEIIFA